MPKLKDINAPKKIECYFNLTPVAKNSLAGAAQELKLTQSEIIENLIMNFDNQKRLFSSFDYIEKRELLFTEIISKVQMSIDLNKEFNNAIRANSNRHEELYGIVEDHKKSFETFKLSLVTYLEGKFNSL